MLSLHLMPLECLLEDLQMGQMCAMTYFCKQKNNPERPVSELPSQSVPTWLEIPYLQKELLLPKATTTQKNILTFDHVVNVPHEVPFPFLAYSNLTEEFYRQQTRFISSDIWNIKNLK